MKSNIFLLSIFLLLSSFMEISGKEYSVIPQPLNIVDTKGEVRLKNQPTIAYATGLLNEAQLLCSYLSVDFSVKAVLEKKDRKANIILQLDSSVLPDKEEGYVLDVLSKSIVIKANSPTGIFYGIQTLRQ